LYAVVQVEVVLRGWLMKESGLVDDAGKEGRMRPPCGNAVSGRNREAGLIHPVGDDGAQKLARRR